MRAQRRVDIFRNGANHRNADRRAKNDLGGEASAGSKAFQVEAETTGNARQKRVRTTGNAQRKRVAMGVTCAVGRFPALLGIGEGDFRGGPCESAQQIRGFGGAVLESDGESVRLRRPGAENDRSGEPVVGEGWLYCGAGDGDQSVVGKGKS